MLLFNLQKAIFAAINVPAVKDTAGIYDYVPEKVPFPFVVIGDDSAAELNTKTEKGYETTSMIHIWGKDRSMKTVKTLIGTLEGLLAKNLGEFEFFKISAMSVRRETLELVKGTLEVKYRVSED